VQIQRQVHAGRYTGGRASPGGVPYKIADGERTIFDQYLLAINAAREVARLGQYEHFALVGIAALNPQGQRRNVYVHAKVMLADDAWATIGSCNLHSNSLYGHTEMNASFWDEGGACAAVRAAGRASRSGHGPSGCPIGAPTLSARRAG
jgi:cardiolipin synthase A/B